MTHDKNTDSKNIQLFDPFEISIPIPRLTTITTTVPTTKTSTASITNNNLEESITTRSFLEKDKKIYNTVPSRPTAKSTESPSTKLYNVKHWKKYNRTPSRSTTTRVTTSSIGHNEVEPDHDHTVEDYLDAFPIHSNDDPADNDNSSYNDNPSKNKDSIEYPDINNTKIPDYYGEYSNSRDDKIDIFDINDNDYYYDTEDYPGGSANSDTSNKDLIDNKFAIAYPDTSINPITDYYIDYSNQSEYDDNIDTNNYVTYSEYYSDTEDYQHEENSCPGSLKTCLLSCTPVLYIRQAAYKICVNQCLTRCT